MARKVTRKSLKHDEFLEAAFDLEQWAEEHWRQAAAVAGGVVAVALVAWGVVSWRDRGAEETGRLLGEGLAKVRQETSASAVAAGDAAARYAAALPDFEKAARGSGGSAARVAAFYQGAALARTGRGAEAVGILESLVASGNQDVLRDVARAKLAWVYMDTGQTDKAVATWKELGTQSDGTYPADYALLHAAEILKGAGRADEAKATLRDLMSRFPQGGAYQEAAAALASVSDGAAEGASSTPAINEAPAP